MLSLAIVARNEGSEESLLSAFIYLNLVPNTIILPLLVGTFLFSRIATRHPVLVNVCITWILSGIFSCLLFYAGQHVGPEPNKALCIAQASLMSGITPMWSVAILMLVCHMVMMFNGDISKNKNATPRLLFMLAAPYVVHFAFSLASLILSIENPEHVSRNRRFFYCSLKMNPLTNTMLVFTFIICIAITVLEIHLAITLYRNWRGIKMARRSGPIDLQILFRVLAFGIYVFFGMIVSLVSVFEKGGRIPDIFAATVGTALILVFGTQADVLRAWCFWRRAPEPVLPQLPVGKGSFSSARINLMDANEGYLDEKKRWSIKRPPIARWFSRY
jgi:hypothetical protein